jgi:tetratricopeptide (TPR) repeat protein
VIDFLIGVIGAVLLTSEPGLANTNVAGQVAVASTNAVAMPEQLEGAYQKLLADDDAAQQEVDKWITENQGFAKKGAAVPNATLNRRIRARLEPVQEAYQDFLKHHPEHVRARIAYGSFLNDLNDEEGAQEQWEKALALEPRNAAILDDLAGIYAHIGPVKKAIDYYEKALQVKPNEPLYYHNLGNVVYLFRKDAAEYYATNEPGVFAKAFELYSNAMRLDPQNFPLACDVAQSYYGLLPLKTEEALHAWTNAMKLASDEAEREGIQIHLARVKILASRFAEAQGHLNVVTNDEYGDVKRRLTRNLNERQAEAMGTNGVKAELSTPGAVPPARTSKD